MTISRKVLDKRINYIYLWISFVSISLISFLVLFIMEREVRLVQMEEMRISEQRIVQLEQDFMGKEIDTILSDIHYLHHTFETQLMEPKNYPIIAKNWAEFSAHRNVYDQIRFIDMAGNERIRINLSHNGSYVVAPSDLQNKKDRYYYTETIKLAKDDVYISQMDLNLENGVIEEPYKPVLRVSTPVFDKNGNRIGLVVMNYLAENVLKRFKTLAESGDGEVILLNSSGKWLSSSDPHLEWNFMFQDRKDKSFENYHPQVWASILEGSGQFKRDEGLFTFDEIFLRDRILNNKNDGIEGKIHLGDGKWYVVSSVLKSGKNGSVLRDDITSIAKDALKKNIVNSLIIIIFAGIVAVLVYINRKSYSKAKFYAEYDTLTKAYNRRAGLERLQEYLPSNNRRSRAMSVCFMDVNGLKQVNDQLGHQLGDELIVSVVEVIQSIIRKNDTLVRMGGDEFLIIFDGIDCETAETVWQRILKGYELINVEEKRKYIISVSHGITCTGRNEQCNIDELISLADELMYEEKRHIKETLSDYIRKDL